MPAGGGDSRLPVSWLESGGLVAAATVFYLAPWSPVYIIALAALAYLTWRRLDLALALVVLAAPLFMHPKHVGAERFSLSEILVVLDLAVAYLYTLLPTTRSRLDWKVIRSSPFFLPACLFLAAATASTLFAAKGHLALREYRETVLEPVAYFALLLGVRSSVGAHLLRLQALVGAGFIASMIGIGQWVSGRGLAQTPGTSIKLVQSVYSSADNLGLLIDRVIPLWLGLIWSRARPRLTALWLAVGLVFPLVLGLSRSRGAEVGAALGALFVIVVLAGTGRWVRVSLVSLAIMVVVAALVGGATVLHAINAGHANTVQERLYLWHSALRMITDHPVFGVGPDNFLHYYAPSYRGAGPHGHGPGWFRFLHCPAGEGYLDPHKISTDQPCLSHPHNEILDFWLSTGVAGLVAFVWMQIAFWRLCARSLGRVSGSARSLLAGIMGAMLASTVHGLVDNSYFLSDLAVFFWLLCASAAWLAAAPQASGEMNARSGEVLPA